MWTKLSLSFAAASAAFAASASGEGDDGVVGVASEPATVAGDD